MGLYAVAECLDLAECDESAAAALLAVYEEILHVSVDGVFFVAGECFGFVAAVEELCGTGVFVVVGGVLVGGFSFDNPDDIVIALFVELLLHVRVDDVVPEGPHNCRYHRRPAELKRIALKALISIYCSPKQRSLQFVSQAGPSVLRRFL